MHLPAIGNDFCSLSVSHLRCTLSRAPVRLRSGCGVVSFACAEPGVFTFELAGVRAGRTMQIDSSIHRSVAPPIRRASERALDAPSDRPDLMARY